MPRVKDYQSLKNLSKKQAYFRKVTQLSFSNTICAKLTPRDITVQCQGQLPVHGGPSQSLEARVRAPQPWPPPLGGATTHLARLGPGAGWCLTWQQPGGQGHRWWSRAPTSRYSRNSPAGSHYTGHITSHVGGLVLCYK